MADNLENQLRTLAEELAQFIVAMDILSSMPYDEAKKVISRIEDPHVREYVLSMFEYARNNMSYNQWVLRGEDERLSKEDEELE